MSTRINPENLEFHCPLELIAQEPPRVRTEANLMVLRRSDHSILHVKFRDLPAFLEKGDVLVLNTTRVNRSKFFGRKKTGGKMEIIFVEPMKNDPRARWKALVRPQPKPGICFEIASSREVVVEERLPGGEYAVSCRGFNPLETMEKEGLMPLPPYIKRDASDPRNSQDVGDYQTVFGEVPGSIAAPTAALHFTRELLQELADKGVEVVSLVLHVGWGTFKPVSGTIETHRMLPEKFEFKEAALERLFALRREGRRIIAVGTTATRVLESLPDEVSAAALSGETDLFIKPGFQFRWLGGLVTNFHVPRSTPIALAAAFAGLDFLEQAYAAAIDRGYRFFSYGDAMLIL